MWILTDIADWFDKQRVEDGKFIDQAFTDVLADVLKKKDDPHANIFDKVDFYAACVDVGALSALYQFSSAIASGFVDVLRIGDGIQKGGWGIAQDGLRLLALAGPALRMARFGLAAVFAADVGGETCTWISSAKALVLTGTKHFASVRSKVSDQRWILDAIGLEIRSIPFRKQARRSIKVPARVAPVVPANGRVVTQTWCIPALGNSDVPSSQRCTPTTVYEVQKGDTLQSIAKGVYGDENRWRGIAAVNAIKNPDVIQPGIWLIIP
jgi:hypothetical protein